MENLKIVAEVVREVCYFWPKGVTMSDEPNTHYFHAPLTEESSQLALASIGKKGSALVTLLLEILGINMLTISRYELRVTISPAYEWDEIEPEVLLAFATVFSAATTSIVRKPQA